MLHILTAMRKTMCFRRTLAVLLLFTSARFLSAAPPQSPLRLSPTGIPVHGNHFHSDAGLTVMDWNRDGLPDLLFHDTGSIGSVTIYLNEGTQAEPRYARGIWLPYNCTETAPTATAVACARSSRS